MRCKTCGKEIGIFRILYAKLCDSCYNKEQEKIKESLEYRREKALGVIEEYHKEMNYYGKPISKLPSGGYWWRGHGWDSEEEILDLIIKNDFDVEKILEKLQKEDRIEEEIEDIKERKTRREIKEEAERRVYGKVKTKRERLDEDLKETIFLKFNHKCTVCNATEGLHIHHKDKNPKNNTIDNLILLCGICHKKVHMKVR